jgi:hypothetical protein
VSRGHRPGHHEPVDETLALLAQNAAESILIAAGNYAAIADGAPANTSTPPTSYVIAAIVLTPKVSGIFRIDVHLTGTDSVSEEVTLGLLGSQVAVAGTPIVLAGGTAAGQLGSSAGAPSVSNGGQVATVPGTPISFTGEGALQGLSTKRTPAVGTDPFEVGTSGIFSLTAPSTIKTPWPIGQTALVYVQVSAPAGQITAMNLDFTVQEVTG